MLYYSERKKVNDGTAVAPVYHTGGRDAMERQFHLNCANVLDDKNPRNDTDACEWGTIEQGPIERKVYYKPQPEHMEQTPTANNIPEEDPEVPDEGNGEGEPEENP